MKPRNFYLFVAGLAVWMVWATGSPALVMALAGSDEFDSVAGHPSWRPTVTIEDLGLEDDDRLVRADTRCLMAASIFRRRIADRIGERMGGLRWHGPVPAFGRVVAADGGTIVFALERGSHDPRYIEDGARDAKGSPFEMAPEPGLARSPC